MLKRRTDLALEAAQLWQESAGEAGTLPGVESEESTREGYPVTTVRIRDEAGARALGKPVGTYVTLELDGLARREGDAFGRAARALAAELGALLGLAPGAPALVVGLGNAAMTPDAVGPLALDSVLITRHLLSAQSKQFSGFRAVAALRPGVLGTTGIEAAEAVLSLTERLQPAAVIAVDALASRRTERVCAALQLSDSGIVPGSGVGNHRAALNRDTLGVPVIAVGVPTVVDAATLAADLLEAAGIGDIDPERLRSGQQGLMVTPRDIDLQVRELGKVIGYAINWALQDLEIEEINALLS